MIIITGGAGFIGSAMLWELNRSGEDNILIVDDLGSTADKKWQNLSGLSFADILPVDAFVRCLAEDKFNDCTAVIHMGAISATTETDADLLLDRNYFFSKNLAGYCMKKDIRLIYASSAATYGDGKAGYRDDEEKLHSLRPLNMYGFSKHLFDCWAKKNDVLKKSAGLKFFNVYGPNEYHKGEMTSVVFKAYNQIRENGVVNLFQSHHPDYLDGEQLRDFISVRDCTKIMTWLLENPEVTGLFNVGTGKARSFRDLVTATFSALDLDPAILYVPMPENLRDKYQYYTCADTDKLQKAGYSGSTTSLEDGIRDYVQNWLVTLTPHFDIGHNTHNH
ncbi:ADP-glyceromanno-heptose 6-epimerase [Chlorobium phaeobacteroides]|jgi:ADP-L-glycero-D-manno-heptose 6-epimerase|uniref:ADP-L-glycero-D-manno-heptose-6-epimerase n=1 Tax=Chlorobium phaeobacteroides (strain DSM 266 / SMG 266 / 2430) TaxID=290317 RepID=A1BGB6_CHLPD|nr:ADP-glyceromanno-heptose 6-epimerase [Chlorobium phaeobacteroides]ABL65443.1 ADP-glyceromanno-heptose 6-epimerase precursor [Chlorobium phaeobacteroides DSM 266]MBV5326193.1 ADP-glyceromanno-heptose 6-epimerase [Chlorobium sp.]